MSPEDYKKALNYAFLLLKYRSRSKSEIVVRLKKKKFSGKIIEKVLDYLQEYNYVNDEEFTRLYVTACFNKGWGQRKIVFNLKRLGIPRELGERFLKCDDGCKRRIAELISKKVRQYKGKEAVFQKIVRYLLGRGFEYADVFEVMQEMGLTNRKGGI